MKKTFVIIDQRGPWTKFLRNVVSSFLLCVLPISLGVVVDSMAMQWVGFFWSALTVFGIAMSGLGEKRAYTIAEARAVLDQMEAGNE